MGRGSQLARQQNSAPNPYHTSDETVIVKQHKRSGPALPSAPRPAARCPRRPADKTRGAFPERVIEPKRKRRVSTGLLAPFRLLLINQGPGTDSALAKPSTTVWADSRISVTQQFFPSWAKSNQTLLAIQQLRPLQEQLAHQ